MSTDPPPDQALAKAQADLDAFYHDLTTYRFYLGPLRLKARFGSMRLARYLYGFHLLTGVAGGILIFQRGPAAELGIALVVGTLFSAGALGAQLFMYQISKERAMVEHEYLSRYQEVIERYRKALSDQTRQAPEQ
jgi:hypothetical protein